MPISTIAAVPRHVGRPLVLAVAGLLAAILIGSPPGVADASVCPAGDFCTATFGDVTYTVIGPCDTSSISAISGCFVVGVGPTPGGSGGPPLNVCSQYGCGPAAIVQEGVSVTAALETEARQRIAALRGVPDDTLNVYWSREQIKAYMYLRLIAMANAAAGSLSAEDQEVVQYYTDLINEERVTVAQAARNLYDQWNSDPCNFKVPVGDPNAYLDEPDVWGTLLNPGACDLAQAGLLVCLSGGCIPPPPTAEQFTAWAEGATLEAEIGAWAKALQEVSPSLTDEQARHSAAFEHDAAAGGIEQGMAYLTATHSELAGIEAGTQTPEELAALLALEETWLEGFQEVADDRLREVVQTVIGQVYTALQNAVADGIAEEAAADAAGLAIETWDTLVGPILAGLFVLSVDAWEQVDNASVPMKLDSALDAARNGGGLAGYASSSEGRALILASLLKSTLPDYLSYRLASPSGVAPDPGPLKDSDPVFQQGASTARTGVFQSFDWNGNFVFTSVRDGWFVQSRNNTWRYTPVVDYVTDRSERWHAWLSGTQFLASRVAIDAGDAEVTDGVNGCGPQSFLLPSGNINLGNTCVLSTTGGAFLKAVKANDQVEIDGQVRTVAAVSADGTWFSTKAPFGDPAPSGRVWIVAHPKGDCATSSSLGDRTQGPDCVKGSSIATSLGTVVMNPRPTLTITASSASVVFGDPVPTITPIYDGFLDGDTAAALTTPPACTTSYTVAALGGTYETHCSGAASSVYNIQYVAGLVTVTVPPLTITASSPTVVYGAPVPAVAPIYDGSNPSSLKTAPTCTTTYTQGSPAGTYQTSCSGAVAPETLIPCATSPCAAQFTPVYSIVYVTGTVTVNPAPLTITASSASVTYGDGAPAVAPSYSGFVLSETAASLTTPPTCTTTYTMGAGVGSYPTTCSGAVGTNYAIGYAAGSITVNPAALKITASSGAMTYGGTPPTITASYGGFVNGDGTGSLTTPPTCSTTATSASPAGTYPSSCSGALAANYTIGYVPGTVTVSYGTSGVNAHKTPSHAGSTIPIKVQLLAANGANVSSASLTLTLTSPAVSPSPSPAAQPTGSFTFVPQGAGGPEYQYNLKTKDYPAGHYTLSFTVTGDPVLHTMDFALE